MLKKIQQMLNILRRNDKYTKIWVWHELTLPTLKARVYELKRIRPSTKQI